MKQWTTWVSAVALAAGLCAGGLVAPGGAAAQEQAAPEQTGQAADAHDARGVLRLGKLYSFGGGAALEHGFGLDMRYELYPDGAEDGYFGLFSQGQYELGDAWRFAGGVNLGWGAFGLEVGVSHRTATEEFAGSTGLHIGQSFTFGPASIGARLTVPLVDHIPQNIVSPMSTQGIEGALVVRIGWGIQLHGPERERRSCHSHGMSRRDPHSHHGQHGH